MTTAIVAAIVGAAVGYWLGRRRPQAPRYQAKLDMSMLKTKGGSDGIERKRRA